MEISQKESKTAYLVRTGMFSMLVTLALTLGLGDVKSKMAAGGNKILSLLYKVKGSFRYDRTTGLLILILVSVCIAYLAKRKLSGRGRNCVMAFSIVAAVLLVMGRCFYAKNSLAAMFSSRFAFAKAMIIVAGYATLIYYGLGTVFEQGIPRIMESSLLRNFRPKRIRITFWSCFAAILIAWSPYIILYYPCNFCNDARDEIAQTLGDAKVSRTAKSINYPKNAKALLNNHHPITYTLLVGGAAKLGMSLGNINIGMFLLAIAQMIVLAMIYSYCVNYIKSLDVPLLFCSLSLGFFMFFPLVPMYAYTITKDSLFGGCMILVTIQLFKMVHGEDVFGNRGERRMTFASCLGLMLFRNNGLYILLVLLVTLLLYYRKSREKMSGVLVTVGIPIALYGIVLLKVVLPLAGIPGGSPREMLSIPFQQVARYAKEWGEDGFEEGEIQALDKILCFDGDVAVLAKRYDPVLSDKVKNKFNKNSTKSDLVAFFDVWKKLFVRHPATFVEATLNNCYYLYSPEYDKVIAYNGVKTEEYWYGLHNVKALSEIRKTYYECLKTAARSSVFGWLFSVGTWDYLFLTAILYAIYKKCRKYLLLTLPVVLNILICVAGPVCYMRYAIEWIVTFPLYGAMVALSYYSTKRKKIDR